MIAGVGVDIESVERFRKSIQNKRFVNLTFKKNELEYYNHTDDFALSLAGKFCAKEAIIKAYDKRITIEDIEIINLKTGKLSVKIKGKLEKNLHISISHSKDHAVAFAVLER